MIRDSHACLTAATSVKASEISAIQAHIRPSILESITEITEARFGEFDAELEFMLY